MTSDQFLFLGIWLGMFGVGGLIVLALDARRARRFRQKQDEWNRQHPELPPRRFDQVFK